MKVDALLAFDVFYVYKITLVNLNLMRTTKFCHNETGNEAINDKERKP